MTRIAGFLVAVFIGPVAFGATYTFTKIADNAGSQFALSVFSGPYLVNNRGVVAFVAPHRDAKGDTVYGIYTNSGGTLTTIVEDSPQQIILTGFNDAGTVVYLKGLTVYTASAGSAPFMVVATANDFVINGQSLPAINNNGTVAVASTNKVIARTGTGAAQTILSDTDLPRAVQLVPANIFGLSMNNAGTIALYAINVATGTSCACGVYVKGTGAASPVVPLTTTLGNAPQINDNGAVAFYGVYEGASGVFVASGGKVAVAVDLAGVLATPGKFAFNNNGKVAFHSNFGGTAPISGMFTGRDRTADRVIATGDPLFGGVVQSITDSTYQGRFLNDSGQVAFGYILNNGVRGIGLATLVNSGTPPPSITAGGIIDGASFSPDTPVAPGSIVSIFGTNFIEQLTVAPGNPLPTALQGVSATFNGIPAPLFFAAPNQIAAQVPFGVTGSSASVQVINPAGRSETRTVRIAPQAPAIFTANQNGVGQGVVVFGNTATIVGQVRAGTDWRPARAGDTITIYANGLGAVTPPINDGWNSCDLSMCAPDLSNLILRTTVVRPQVKIGNVTVPDSLVQFSGLVPQFAGLYQVNVTIPNGITPGNSVPVVIQMGTAASAQNVTIALQ